MKAIRLRTDYLSNPMGIDDVHPHLFWNCENVNKQTAFQIIAKMNDNVVWDTGKIDADSMRAVYNGTSLKSRDAVQWQVRIWDEKQSVSEWSEEAKFEIGLLNESDWQSHWITGNYVPKTRKSLTGDYTARKVTRYPVDCFKKDFQVEQADHARLYITACGLYEAFINGKRVGDFVLAPGHTDYRKRVQYQTYDVTSLLIAGKNSLTVFLADGWYRGSIGAWGLLCQYGYETKFIAQLEIVKTDGSRDIVKSDDTWSWSNDGPIRFADNKDGEIFDARMGPSYQGKAKCTDHSVVPCASDNVPVLEHENFKPTIITTPSGKTVLDFHQNIAGYISFDVNAESGQRIFIRFGEILDENGEFTQNNIQCKRKDKITPLQQIDYTCCDGSNHYKTSFAVFGFQYALVETDVKFNEDDFTAIAVYSDIEQTGFFESSNRLLNKFVENTIWSAKGNFLDIPTDCPTRERHGWTGDAQLFCKTASYLFDFMPFGNKYLTDVFDVQAKNGKLPQIAPVGGTDFFMGVMDGSVGWADAGVLMPYRLWKQYNDSTILKKYYPQMKAYAHFMQSRCGKKVLLSKPLHLHGAERRYAVNAGQVYGEWAEPNDIRPFQMSDFTMPHPEESTAYTCFIMEHMAEIAKALGKTNDAKEYQEWADHVRSSYQALVELPEFSLDTDRQAKLVRPLYMHLLNANQKNYAQKRLIQALEHYGWRLGTGFLSTPLILYVLADIDLEAAYKLLENEEIPGWLSMPKAGATTIWESWEAASHKTAVDSRNHYSKGALCEWLFTTMCGIQISGENHFIISPRPGGHFEHAKASYQSIFGTVESGWVRENQKTTFTITIPSNCTADIDLPNGQKKTVESGKYEFEMNL
jgi:alpha-L-rhamnosidase